VHPTYVALTWIKHRTPPENMGAYSLHHEAPLGFKNVAESSKSPFTLTHRFMHHEAPIGFKNVALKKLMIMWIRNSYSICFKGWDLVSCGLNGLEVVYNHQLYPS